MYIAKHAYCRFSREVNQCLCIYMHKWVRVSLCFLPVQNVPHLPPCFQQNRRLQRTSHLPEPWKSVYRSFSLYSHTKYYIRVQQSEAYGRVVRARYYIYLNCVGVSARTQQPWSDQTVDDIWAYVRGRRMGKRRIIAIQCHSVVTVHVCICMDVFTRV